MVSLVAVKGPIPGQRFSLDEECTLVGRQPDARIYLESLAVSRQHANIHRHNDVFTVEDLGSSNGTYVNGQRISRRMPLTDRDVLQIGPYVLALRVDRDGNVIESDPIVRAEVNALTSNQNLYAQNPAYKLQVVLEIARHLGDAVEPDAMLSRMLDHLLRLFPQAERGMVLRCRRDQFVIKAARGRGLEDIYDYPYSKTIVRRALDEGVGLLSEDVGGDNNLVLSATLMSLNVRSFLCVPLIGGQGSRLGVIQLDCVRPGQRFHADDLEVLTAVALQVAVVLENLSLHAERLREEGLRQEVALAREIQQSFLPKDFGSLADIGVDLFARVHPAREVSGDLYDFFLLPDGRLAFFLGDVSGKGMPAALFMIAVRTLSRHLAPTASSPAEVLRLLNAALVADNPTALFVTLIHGVYDPRDGSVVLSSGGHPAPLLRRSDGRVEEVTVRPGPLLGFSPLPPQLVDTRLTLVAGETLILYTDGFTEAFSPEDEQFGLKRLTEVLGGERTNWTLERGAEEVENAVRQFTGQDELQDDQTLLLLRRR